MTSSLTFPIFRALPLQKVFLKLFVLLSILLRQLPMFLTIVLILSLIPIQSIFWTGQVCFIHGTVARSSPYAARQTKQEHELILSYLEAISSCPILVPESFSPQLNIKCGPLLRYTGLRGDGTFSENCTAKEERETWRGSVMIVTTDDLSDYSRPPAIRLFVQPASEAIRETDCGASAEAATVSATGEYLAARPAEELPSKSDMSRDDLLGNVATARQVNDGEKLGRYKEVEATKLHAERGVTFWRFIIEVELGDEQARVGYRINHGPSIAFWVPARGQTMNIMFHSCNGFSLSVNPDDFCGPDPLWRDVLREHRERPFHVMLGGGDQSKLSDPWRRASDLGFAQPVSVFMTSVSVLT